MDSKLLETVLQSAYDAGYKDGYTKAVKNMKFSEDIESVKKQDTGQKQWLTPSEIAEEFGIATSTQAKYRAKMIIPYHKIGGYIRYKRNDIDKWLDSGKII